VIDENGPTFILPRKVLPRKVLLKLYAICVLRFERLKDLGPDEREAEALVGLKASLPCDKSSILMYGDGVKEPITFDTST